MSRKGQVHTCLRCGGAGHMKKTCEVCGPPPPPLKLHILNSYMHVICFDAVLFGVTYAYRRLTKGHLLITVSPHPLEQHLLDSSKEQVPNLSILQQVRSVSLNYE